MPLLDGPGIADFLAMHEAWRFDEQRAGLVRRFEFADFGEAFAFMTRTALLAEKMNHHPEWSNIYNRVEVLLRTHDAGGVTEIDVEMARAMEAFAVTGTDYSAK